MTQTQLANRESLQRGLFLVRGTNKKREKVEEEAEKEAFRLSAYA